MADSEEGMKETGKRTIFAGLPFGTERELSPV